MNTISGSVASTQTKTTFRRDGTFMSKLVALFFLALYLPYIQQMKPHSCTKPTVQSLLSYTERQLILLHQDPVII